MLVNIAFVTLLERKILGLRQLRKGPNKVSFLGIFQPIRDALKLFAKENTFPLKGNPQLFYFSPILGLFLALVLWSVLPLKENLFSFLLSVILFITLLRFNVYPIILIG